MGRGSIKLDPVTIDDFAVPASGPSGPVIGLVPGTILTEHLTLSLPYRDGMRDRDLDQDVLKVCVFARHWQEPQRRTGFRPGASG